jgi:hypothetical protein
VATWVVAVASRVVANALVNGAAVAMAMLEVQPFATLVVASATAALGAIVAVVPSRVD